MPLRIALAAAFLIGSSTALAGNWVDVSIVSRDSQQRLDSYRHRGKTYVPGQPSEYYAVRMTNRSGRRVMVVLSVDGLNAITGQDAAPNQSGYVLEAGDSTEITGWRKSADEVAGFYFTRLPDSYAARTDRPDNVGVIGVAVFREYVAPRPPAVTAPRPYSREQPIPAPGAGAQARAESGQASEAQAPPPATSGLQPAPEDRARLGTGHGTRESSPVTYTSFRRAASRPDEVITIYYDSYDNLLASGVIPGRPYPPARPEPRPFPGGFVPDPPR